ncbi:sorbosone dehydrogenase family protein [Massilia sp. HP4]|uniref:PQQ-dependent sugar dehydrogenase n=1 Tax=Massilia sp. HP4 TaxID=2562316 RepID=UPI0010C028E2|nr:sorbosone dehydrogenase family protein [Massilia sp. HP4]
MRQPLPALCAGAAMLVLAACGDKSTLPMGADVGSQPTLKAPNETLIPTVNIAPARGWPSNMTPTPAPGLAVNAFGTALDHPRWIYVLPNGDVLVAESNAPERPAKKGIGNWVTSKVMERAGAGVPSANRISLLRDADGDGVAELKSVFLKDLHSPFGMALVGDSLYVANTDAVVRFPYKEGATEILDKPQQVAPLPGGPLNHHWTKNIIASKDGSKLYATAGSNSNVAENGMDQEKDRAAILEIDIASGKTRVFASGLRNPNGMAWNPETGALWTVVNERDLIGSDLVPDYLTSVKDGGFYGWPYSYFGKNVDTRVKPPRPDLVEQAIVPDYALGAHVAALGLAFYEGSLLPAHYRNGAIIGNHGSWNRKPRSGYNVVFVPFKDGRPAGKPVDMLTDFVNKDGEAHGRPVGVAIDRKGAVLVADDVGNVIWRVVPDPG